MDEYSFDKHLKLTKIALLYSGIDLNEYKNKFWNYFMNFVFYFNLIWLYTDVFGEFWWLIEGIEEGKSFSELSLTAPCTTICLLASSKSAPVFFYRHTIVKVVEKLRQIHPILDGNEYIGEGNDNKIEDEEFFEDKATIFNDSNAVDREIVKGSIKFLNAVVKMFFYSASVVVLVFTTLPLLVMAYEYYAEGKTELILPFLAKYFFDPTTKTKWLLIYVHQVWSTYIAAFNTVGADTFLYAFCSYVDMHFRILSHRFELVIVSSNDTTNTRLTALVRRHQELIELVSQVEMVFSKSILFNMVSSSVLICLSGFNVTFLDDNGAVFAFFTFLIMSLSQISLLCWFGDMLVRSSTKVSEAVYKCRWYDVDSGIKKSIFLILMRSQKPCKLTAAKFADLNLTAFTTILSRSWSYFALLRTVYK